MFLISEVSALKEFFSFKWLFWKKNAAVCRLVIQNFEKNGIKVATVGTEK